MDDHKPDGHADDHRQKLGCLAVLAGVVGLAFWLSRHMPGEWPELAGLFLFACFLAGIKKILGGNDSHGHH